MSEEVRDVGEYVEHVSGGDGRSVSVLRMQPVSNHGADDGVSG